MMKKLLYVATILLVVVFAAMAADATGKWVAEIPGRNGGPARQQTFNLKADGSKLTGTVSGGMGRQGAAPADTEISNGKVEGDKISFEVKREFNGNTMVTKYSGTISGDELKMKSTTETQNGPMEREITAKKSTT